MDVLEGSECIYVRMCIELTIKHSFVFLEQRAIYRRWCSGSGPDELERSKYINCSRKNVQEHLMPCKKKQYDNYTRHAGLCIHAGLRGFNRPRLAID